MWNWAGTGFRAYVRMIPSSANRRVLQMSFDGWPAPQNLVRFGEQGGFRRVAIH
jgi:hypothetical protein